MSVDWAQRAAAIEDPLRRKLYAIGVLTARLRPKGMRPVIVGGTAVEWYTQGLYRSGDVDFLCPWTAADEALRAMGFERHGRHWFREDLGLVMEAPADTLESYRDRTRLVQVEGLDVVLVSPEEAILDRLRAGVQWKSALDCEQAFHMMVVHDESLDWEYMDRRAVRDQVTEKLQELRKRLPEIPD